MNKVHNHYKIANVSYIHVGGYVDKFIESDDLIFIKHYISTHQGEKYLFISNSSKILFAFDDAKVTVIRYINSSLKVVNNLLYCGAGVNLNYLSYWSLKNEYQGFERLVKIPGLIGGSIANNSGAFKQCISDHLIKVYCLDLKGNFIVLDKAQMEFGYRSSILKKKKNSFLIVGAVFKLIKEDHQLLLKKYQDAIKYRIKNQEISHHTLGSTFKNKDQVLVAPLIEKLQLKGKVFYQVLISPKHANFLLINPLTDYRNIVMIIALMTRLLYNNFGYLFEPEIIIYSEMEFKGNGKSSRKKGFSTDP